MKISNHFHDWEVGKSSTAERLGIDNTPPEVVMDRAIILATGVLDPIREEFGAYSAQSWYRCELLEQALTWKTGFRNWCRRKNRAWAASTAALHVRPDVNLAWAQYFARKSHPRGEAGDIEVVGISNDDLYAWVEKNLVFDQLIREFPKEGDPRSGWVHVSLRKRDNRRQAFTIP